MELKTLSFSESRVNEVQIDFKNFATFLCQTEVRGKNVIVNGI